MSGFSFGKIKVSSKKQVLNLKVMGDSVIADHRDAVSDSNTVVGILVDEYYNEYQLTSINKFLRKCGITKYIMLCTINCDTNKDEVKEKQKCGVIEFYENNKSNFMDYITPCMPLITSGPSLYSLLMEDDIYPSHVQQRIFGKASFWYSKDQNAAGNWVFPIESFRDLYIKGFNKPIDSFKTKLAQVQCTNAQKQGNKPGPRYPHLNKIFIKTKEEFNELFYEPNKDKKDELLSWDLETSGLNFFKDRIGCITLSFDGVTGYYIPWRCVDKKKLNEILKNNRQLGANLKFDIKFMWKNGVPDARIDEDVLLMAHVLDETRFNSLKAMAFFYSEYGGYERPLDTYKKKMGFSKDDSYLDIDEDILKEYAIMDAIVCRRIFNNMLKHMRALDKQYPNEKCSWNTMEEYYYYRRIPVANMYAKLEYQGVFIRKDKLDALRKEMQEYANELRLDITNQLGVSNNFDIDSNLKLGKLLAQKGWEDLGRAKSGEYLVADFQLSRWKKVHPVASVIQQYRSITTLLSTFVGDDEGTKGWSQYLVHHDGDPENVYRMHPDYKPMGTDSGRTRCGKPNMQNVPTRGKFTKEIKSCICTPNDDEYLLVTVDYSSLQMRLAAIDSNDVNLNKALKAKKCDLHSNTAWLTFCQGKEFDIENIEVEQDGKTYHFLGGEKVITKRGEIFAKDLTEDDELIVD